MRILEDSGTLIEPKILKRQFNLGRYQSSRSFPILTFKLASSKAYAYNRGKDRTKIRKRTLQSEDLYQYSHTIKLKKGLKEKGQMKEKGIITATAKTQMKK